MMHNTQSITPFKKVIAIDGPSGSGKSAVAKNLSQELGILYIDTGSMFRALAYFFHHHNIPFEECAQSRDFLAHLQLNYGIDPQTKNAKIHINDLDLTDLIRAHEVSTLASMISSKQYVRDYLLNYQRNLAENTLCVMEGRDIGTVVFPDAFIKFFVTATVETRAVRRFEQLNSQTSSQGPGLTMEQIILDVKKRDETDMNRPIAPLKMAIDAEYIDTSNLDLPSVTKMLAEKVRSRAHGIGIFDV